MRFDRSEAALVLIDLQRGFVDAEGFVAIQGRDVSASRQAADRCVALARAARAAGMRVIWTRHVLRADYADAGLLVTEIRPRLGQLGALKRGTADVELYSGAEVHPSDIIVDKPRYSAFFGTDLDVIFAANGIRSLVLGGVTTSMCVETTARDAAQRDMRTFVVREAVADFDQARHDAALSAIAFGFGRVVGLDAMAEAMAEGTAEFPIAA
ncbi:MAG: isochorismatase family cysteine hydrolase [Phreatobacter sp.]|uniref:cysteine hydrolase family protein n=1 Tax=Phreatobacter sp. TaxID=1966341 RepID=UPI002734E45D|nr:isochorismatase family cysteine hydrolase [Phreatobacter sp.]MDP2802137.1 isochorismatase family cysteine hydrolase [Phreatobacter sp.]